MSIRVTLDAGEHRIVSTGADGVPVEALHNRGPGAVLVEGRMVDPQSSWAADGRYDRIVVSTLPDDPTTVEVV